MGTKERWRSRRAGAVREDGAATEVARHQVPLAGRERSESAAHEEQGPSALAKAGGESAHQLKCSQVQVGVHSSGG